MLRNSGIRAKLLALVSIPMVFLLVMSGIVVAQAAGDNQRARQVQQLTDASTQLGAFVHRLQLERGYTIAYLAAPGAERATQMRGQRRVVDTALQQLRAVVAQSGITEVSAEVRRGVDAAEKAHNGLAGIRAQVDGGKAGIGAVQQFYTHAIALDLGLPELVARTVDDATLTRALETYGALSAMLEYAGQERDLLGAAAAAGKFPRDQFVSYAGALAQEELQLSRVRALATPEQRGRLDRALAETTTAEFTRARAAATASGQTGAVNVDPQQWETAANARLDALTGVERAYAQHVADVAAQAAAAAQFRVGRVATAVLVAVLVAVLLALVVARRMVLPLSRLTNAAEQIGVELPKMVERVQHPGEDPQLVVEPIEVFSRDEIGRLAEAFNTVNEVSVRVAVEQAALRGSIAEMFTNVARRNQTLLARQLAFLDQLEEREEDPEALDNLFRLDHLAARMRRNAESLLVLAGIDSTKRLRQPMPLSDVVRTAISEIESYDRVDLTIDADPAVAGRSALAIAHLLAELLDNATQFSDPQTRVQVTTGVDPDGVRVEVWDAGLGMTPEELEEANHRLANPPATEIAVAQRLGFYVVGRIAQRLDAVVSLRGRRAGGTSATVLLPAAVFVGDLNTPPTPVETPAPPAIEAAQPAPAPQPNEPEAAAQPAPAVEAGAAAELAAAAAPAASPASDAEPAPVEPEPAFTTPPPIFAAPDILPGKPMRRPKRTTASPAASAAPTAPPAPAAPDPAPPTAQPEPQPRPAAQPAPVPQPAAPPEPVPELEPLPLPTAPADQPAPQAAAEPATPDEAVPASADAAEAQPHGDDLMLRALAELSQLSAAAYTPTYQPAETPGAAPGGLARRTPKPVADATQSPAAAPAAPAVPAARSANEVRSVLAGFRDGVERGRRGGQTSVADEAGDPQKEGQS